MILKDRYWEITVGGVKVSSSDSSTNKPLTVEFEVSKSLDREPNSAMVKIANLSASRRQQIESADEPELQIIAGYQGLGLRDTIFVGDAKEIYSTREGPDIWLNIEAKDGGKAYRTARLATTFPANTALSNVITALARAMGVGVGNAAAVASAATLDSGGALFPNGLALEGPAWRSLNTVCRSASLRWSVQNGVLQLRRRRNPADVVAVLLGPETGLVGSPSRAARDPRTRDITVDAKALLIPGIFPGKVVVLKSSTVTGSWMVHSVRYTGNSTGNDWYADMTLKDYDAA